MISKFHFFVEITKVYCIFEPQNIIMIFTCITIVCIINEIT